MTNEYKRREGEDDIEYGLRLIAIKIEQRPEDLEWSDIVDFLKLDVHKDSLRKAASVTPFSGYSVMKYFQDKIYKLQSSQESSEADDKILEIKRLTQIMRDERMALDKKTREYSRSTKIIDIFKRIITEHVSPAFECSPVAEPITTDSDMVVLLSDLHFGIESRSYFNEYSPSIAIDRLLKYLDEIRTIASRHKSENCYLFLGGDLISGNIKTTIQNENIENVVEQIKDVSALITDFTHELSQIFKHGQVHVYHCPGNHSRVVQKKEDNQHGDYLDSLIPHYMNAALHNQVNIAIHENKYDAEICDFKVRGHSFVGVHGHHDTITGVVTSMTRLLEFIPDVVLMGHRHTNSFTSVDKSKVIACGSLCGMDNYTIDKRLVGRPEQAVLVVSNQKCIECFYDLQLD